ncbi:type II CAAX endopeptidase family protein [Flammeovirga sp. SubArs3]|uniref:CPBP family intramembrane glutamic endopeptidase n=1 Tax=Flammeovirga sp. SubArs3 TaxID=2995316 RepID=UPI00248CE257|nr:type II CAAX endopeptidase family protein [Flammeovirga sp. SubArs3]
MQLLKKTFFPNIWETLLFTITLLGEVYLSKQLGDFLKSSDVPEFLILTMKNILLLSLITYLVYRYQQYRNSNTKLELSKVNAMIVLFSICAHFCIIIAIGPLTLIPWFNEAIPAVPLETNVPLKAAIVVFIAPFLEEVIFRGIIQRGLLKNYSPWIAISVSGLAFGLCHIINGSVVQFIFTAVYGLFWGWIYYKTRNLAYTIILHIFQNGITFIQLLNLNGAPQTNEFDFEDPIMMVRTISTVVIFSLSALFFNKLIILKLNGQNEAVEENKNKISITE